MSEERNDDIGTLLKVRRQELGLSLQDAAERTRIRKSYLESLEASQFSDLPGNAYVTGFIRVYARYLDLDCTPLLAMLEIPSSERLQASRTPAPALRTHISITKKKKSRGNGGLFVSGFIVVLILGAVLYFLLSGGQKAPTPVTEQAPVRIENDTQKDQQTVVAEPVVEEALPAEETPQDIEAPLEESTPVEITAEETVLPLLLTGIKPEGSSLRMLALSQGSLIIHVDNRKPHDYALHEGLDLTWKIREKVSLELGGAKQALFWLDGREIELGDHRIVQLTQAP